MGELLSASASLTDHSFATGKLIEVNFFLFCAVREDADRVGSELSNRMGRSAGKLALPWHVPEKHRAGSDALSRRLQNRSVQSEAREVRYA
ncbi:hypothetical protein ACF1BQ_014480 [Bradyrhizobium sp. RDT10]